jgi:hypothetical protein
MRCKPQQTIRVLTNHLSFSGLASVFDEILKDPAKVACMILFIYLFIILFYFFLLVFFSGE